MHKIALNGFGRIGRILYSNPFPYVCTESYALTTRNQIIENEFSELTRVFKRNNEEPLTLVQAYKAVQKKYYPEKDIYKKKK